MSEMTTVGLAATVRKFIDDGVWIPQRTQPANHALDALLARCEEAERERDAIRADRDKLALDGMARTQLAKARVEAAEVEVARLTEALECIRMNARSWHSDEEGKQRALNVIGTWAADPGSIPGGVRNAAREALAARETAG